MVVFLKYALEQGAFLTERIGVPAFGLGHGY